jgi:hypothetical protein
VIATPWELSKNILDRDTYPRNKTFGKMTALITEVFAKRKIFILRKDTCLERSM